MINEPGAVIIRPMSDDAATRERRFVRETSIKVRWPRRAGIGWNDWTKMHGPDVDAYMDASSTMVAEAGGVLLGFRVMGDKYGVAMLYVKAAFRGQGIGLRLLGIGSERELPTGRPRVSLSAYMPTAAWGRWCNYHGLRWERARL